MGASGDYCSPASSSLPLANRKKRHLKQKTWLLQQTSFAKAKRVFGVLRGVPLSSRESERGF